MIVGDIREFNKFSTDYPEAVRKALHYLGEHNFAEIKDGKYPIDGENSFAIVQRYNTRPVEKCRPEAHKKYVDIQFLAEGEECLGWCPLSPDLDVDEAYDEEKDIVFYKKLVPDNGIILSKGIFAVLYPNDVHQPCASTGEQPKSVIKVVVKILADLV